MPGLFNSAKVDQHLFEISARPGADRQFPWWSRLRSSCVRQFCQPMHRDTRSKLANSFSHQSPEWV